MNITLGQFIESQLKQRQMSAREFAKFIGVPHSTVSRYRRHVTGNNDIYTPSGDFMYRLAKATHTDIGYLWRLVYPDLPPPGNGITDETAMEFAKVIESLPDATRQLIREFVFSRAGRPGRGDEGQ